MTFVATLYHLLFTIIKCDGDLNIAFRGFKYDFVDFDFVCSKTFSFTEVAFTYVIFVLTSTGEVYYFCTVFSLIISAPSLKYQ
jgi:hypothetical protein